jgi:hypothetical protein
MKERSGSYLDIWEGPKIVRDEIISLEVLLSSLSARFASQLDHLITLQEEEYHVKSLNVSNILAF